MRYLRHVLVVGASIFFLSRGYPEGALYLVGLGIYCETWLMSGSRR